MIHRILREIRQRRRKPIERWQKARRKRERLERKLEKVTKYTEPDDYLNAKGIVVGVHVLRNRFNGPEYYRFEFFRKESTRYPFCRDFGENDLDLLANVVLATKRHVKKMRRTRDRKRT